jgi:PAS domain S-box-containing protein
LLVLAVAIMGLGHAILARQGHPDSMALTAMFLMTVVGVGGVLWWCQRHIRAIAEGYRRELEHQLGVIAHDITECKQAEAKLAEQKDLLETILQQAAEAIVMCDAQGNPMLVNAAARRLALGETRDQPEAGPNFLWGKAYYPDGHPVPLQAWPLQKALRGDTTVGAEARVVRPDGSAYDVLISAAPVRRGDHEIVGAVAMFSDITERKRVEEKLLYQLRLTQGITDSATDSIFMTDAEGRVTCINPEAERAFGYSTDELIGEVLHDRLHHHHSNGRQFPAAECPLARIYTSGETVRDYEDVFFRKDGSTLTVLYSNALLESRGKRLGAVLFVRNITESKQAEATLRENAARLRAIVHAVPDVLLVLDAEGRYLEVLTAQPELLYADYATLKGRLIGEVLPRDVAQRTLTAIDRTLSTGRIQSFEYELAIQKIGKRYFEARAAPVDGLLMGRPAVVLLAREVTQHRLTEERLRQAQKMEALGQLTGGVAHDFNNLLAIIQGNLELLAEALDRPELQDLVQRALGAVERGTALISQLLAFGRRQPLHAKPANLNTLVAGMSDLLRRTLGETIRLDIVLAEDLAMTVIDPSQFETALLNLVLNARDAMPDGGRLTLETATVWLDQDYAALHRPINPGRYVLLAVRDTGIGMSPEVLEHVMEPFFTTKEAGKGSGLGLSMVYGLVNQMEGTMHLHSEEGQGTTVNIYLPASKTDTDAAPEPDAGETPQQPGQGQLVLVVEDEALVRQLAVNMLQSLGYRTLEADTAAAALQVLEATPSVAALFTDVVLPGGESGVDLARAAQRRRPGLKVLFTSGYVGHHLAAFSRQKGAGWLGKPYRKSQLASKLHALLGSAAARPPKVSEN